jgi:low temperature requirement protein LtrA
MVERGMGDGGADIGGATRAGRAREEPRVSTLELFFDLVFVFTITQLTTVLTHHPNGVGVLRVALMLVVIWWMYGGYAWLTNVVAPDRLAYQLLLLGGMGAFLVISLAIPTAFGGGGVAFGLAYLVVVLIHSGLFSRSQVGASGAAILRVAPLNLVAALAIVAAGIAGGPARGVLWGVAVAVIILPSLRPPDPRFEIAPGHFVERHGLVVIVALGESVVAVGIGATAHALTLGLIAVAVLGLALTACLWWAYFGEREDERALEAMRSAGPGERPRLALTGFYHWHLLILFGIIALASALESGIAHPVDPLSFARSLALAGGVACFLIGDALFRRTLSIGETRWRLTAAAFALVTLPLGFEVSAVAQLSALVAVLLMSLFLELGGRRAAAASP